MSGSEINSVRVLPGTSQQSPHQKSTILPPLTSQFPQWSRGTKLEISVIPKPSSTGDEKELPWKVFGSRVNKKSGPDLGIVGRSEGLMVATAVDPMLRVAQLEQNIRFLQEQHQLMLSSLHQEVEQLRCRNRELQFQLIFSKGRVAVTQASTSSSNASSPEDDVKPKIILSPKQLNVIPLQVELLEKDVSELKAALQETRAKNVYLSGVVEEQRIKLEKFKVNDSSQMKELEAVGNKITPASRTDSHQAETSESKDAVDGDESDLVLKLSESEKVIRRLRRENDEQRRELALIKSNMNKSHGGNNHRGAYHRPHSQQQSQRFPPLHTKHYWNQGHRANNEFSNHRNGNNGSSGTHLEKDSHMAGRTTPSLPNLRTTNNATTSGGYSTFSNSGNHRKNHYHGNGNHYYRNSKDETGGAEGRKFRTGGGSTGN